MTAILLAFSIVAPMLLGGSFRAYYDMRGGDGVNSAEQMKYILNYPIKYINTLINHGKDYLSIKHVYEYSQNYGYMSYVIKPPFSKLSSISLVTVSILDQEKEKNPADYCSRNFWNNMCNSTCCFFDVFGIYSGWFTLYRRLPI